MESSPQSLFHLPSQGWCDSECHYPLFIDEEISSLRLSHLLVNGLIRTQAQISSLSLYHTQLGEGRGVL